jgi:hypothetical protein
MKNRTTEQAGTRKRERGSILATSAIGMLSILLAVGLGVDISRFYLTSKLNFRTQRMQQRLLLYQLLMAPPTGIEAAIEAVARMNNYDFNKTGINFPPGQRELFASQP